MAIGTSGRIVIDISPEEKKAIHADIKAKGMTLKEWFLEKAYEELPSLKSNKNGENSSKE
ncbi:hypothetical protein [Planctobacterium marinum]|uniref:Uncharacterized protein n=1 Tax=Planctobacterium marinum TaxID=1631968 RepID=A0AA48KUC6_9ALTE|nr:hypothetical protein MACH26_39700 [Planctobacterium marinum]